jgi:hypothetical protein
MNLLKSIVLSLFLFVTLSSILAQKAVLDTNYILIGDQVALKIQAEIKKGAEIRFPLFDKTLIDGIEIISQGLDTINNGKTLENVLYITAFEDSVFTIPPIPITIGKDTLRTNSVKLAVGLYKPDSSFLAGIDTTRAMKIRDIKPIMETPWTFKEFWKRFGNYILIGFGIILLAVAVLYYIIRRLKNKPIFIAPKPKLPPHIIANQALNALKEEKLWQKGKTKEYYTQLTDIVRVYIENRFSVPAMESTSYEILTSLGQLSEISNESGKSLGRLLSNADLVKFAKAQPTELENDESIKTAYDFVDKTKLVSEEKSPEQIEPVQEQSQTTQTT